MRWRTRRTKISTSDPFAALSCLFTRVPSPSSVACCFARSLSLHSYFCFLSLFHLSIRAHFATTPFRTFPSCNTRFSDFTLSDESKQCISNNEL